MTDLNQLPTTNPPNVDLPKSGPTKTQDKEIIANTIEEDPQTEEAKQKEKDNDDDKSIYIKNVDYSTEQKELEAHFSQCGKIEKVTIVCDKFNGRPLGYDYLQKEDMRI